MRRKRVFIFAGNSISRTSPSWRGPPTTSVHVRNPAKGRKARGNIWKVYGDEMLNFVSNRLLIEDGIVLSLFQDAGNDTPLLNSRAAMQDIVIG